MKNILIILLIVLTGCSSTPPQKLEQGTFYRRDMIMTVDGKAYEGVAVIPQKEINKFHVRSRGELDLFAFTTCHREKIKEKAWNVKKEVGHWFWKRKIDKKREVTFDFRPTRLESFKDYCPIIMGGYEAKRGRNSWSFVDVQDKKTNLKAYIDCNGDSYWSKGVTVCQARKDLLQSVQFEEPVNLASKPECEIGKNTGKYFQFPIKRGRCVYKFRTKDKTKPRKHHRLTTLGYEGLLIREL